MKETKIVPSKYYTLVDLVSFRLFHYTSLTKIREIVAQDRTTANILNPIVTGRGRGKKYLFKGENIIKFVKGIKTGMVNLPEKN